MRETPKRPGPEADETPRPLRWRHAWQILRRHFAEVNHPIRAAALTYATLLSSVPFLAVVLSILRALGVEERFVPFLVERLRIGGDQPAEVILRRAEGLDLAALGAAGAVGLLLTALLLLAQVDSAFNAIWGVRENRPLHRRLVGYGGILVIGPLWIAFWTSAVSSLRLAATQLPDLLSGFVLMLLRTAGPLLVLFILAALYLVAPNTHVSRRAALVGASVATLLLEASQFLFLTWIRTSVAYDFVYGAFAALPVFLAWVYINWLVVLLGAEIAYLFQSVPTWLREAAEPESLAWEERERLALASAALLAARAADTDPDDLARDLEVSPRLVQHTLDDLEDAGWITPIGDDMGQVSRYRPSGTLARATLAEVRRSLRALGGPSALGARRRALYREPAWMGVLEPLERASDRPFEERTTLELARSLRPGSAGAGETAPT